MRRLIAKVHSGRWLALLAALVLMATLCVPAVSADEVTSGDCGEGLTWSFAVGTLTISGSGAMTDYTEQSMAPWYPLRDQIYRLQLPEGLTHIGALAFYECANLSAVALPNAVQSVGMYAFASCTGMTLLDLGSGVQSVGEAAFYDCHSITALRLPNSLRRLDTKAFYRCEALTTITIPASVEEMGVLTFAYCKSLVSAQVNATIRTLPQWTFFYCTSLADVTLPDTLTDMGDYAFMDCAQLSTVYHNGENILPEKIEQEIIEDLPTFDTGGFVTSGTPSDSATSGSFTENPDGTVTQGNITVHDKPESTVTVKTEHTYPSGNMTGGTVDTSITVTVDGENGWSDAAQVIVDALKGVNNTASAAGATQGTVGVTVQLKGTDTVDSAFIDALAGRDMTLTVQTANGSSWKMECAAMARQELSGNYTLTYTVAAATAEQCEKMGVTEGYVLTFHTSAEVEAEVLIRLPAATARRGATLFQQSGKPLTRHQTVLVDGDGCAHFYLASVNHETDYFIGMDAPASEEDEEVIIPDNMLQEYGNAERYQPITYAITGRKSSWGMSFGQVTWILVGALVACVAVVGGVLYVLNKRKLKNGYVPPMDEEE